MAKAINLMGVLLAGALGLTACGGGGGAGGGTANLLFVDSFGNDVSAFGYSSGDSGADGTAGDGAPIVGGTVTITDSKGKTVSAFTDTKGYFRAKVTGFTPPMVAEVKGTTGKAGATTVTRYAVSVKTLTANKFVTLNLSPLTSKVASDAAVALGQTDASKLTPAVLSASTASTSIASSINTSLSSLRTQLQPVIVAAGLSTSSFNPLDTPFYADSKGYDYVLDNVSLTNATTISIKSSFTGTASCPFAGTYSGTFSGRTAADDSGTFTASVNGNCQLSATGNSVQGGFVSGSGTVSSTGAASAVVGGSTSTGATFTGNIVNHVFSGSWSNASSGQSGSFNAK